MPYLPRNEKIYAFEHIQQLFLRLVPKLQFKKLLLLVYDNLKI